VSTRIDAVDPSSERDLVDAAALETAYVREVIGEDEPAMSTEEVLGDFLHTTRPDIAATMLVARDGGTPVGLAFVDIRTGHGNEHLAWLPDLFVQPSHRRRGIGGALLEEITAVARAAGRTLLASGFAEGHADGEAFAASVGARLANRERQNRARVAAMDRAMLESWVADAATKAAGYSLVAFDDTCPDDLLDDFVALMNTMNDAPRSESLDDFVFTAEQRRAAEAERELVGGGQWVVCARHDATGELAGYTELGTRPYKRWLAEQGDTAVTAAHRGHGIGRWLKAANALRLIDERPEVEVIETWNDGTNQWMLAINDAMGFRPVATWVEAELDV